MPTEDKNMYYEMTINCMLDGVDTTLYFDYVGENSITLNTTITEHPLVSGDMIADHQYIEPATASFSGTFSLYGNKKSYAIMRNNRTIFENYGSNVNDRLSYIQEIFERIQKDGIHCNIVKLSTNNDSSRFKARKNMILNSITWTERQFSVDFDFSFREALSAEVPYENDYFVDDTDNDLPYVTQPVQRSAVDELLDKNQVIEALVFTLLNENLDEEKRINSMDFSRYAKDGSFWNDTKKSWAQGAVIGTVVTVASMNVIAGLCGGLAAAFPVGTLIAVGIGTVVCIASAITLICKKVKQAQSYNIKAFKYYKRLAKKQKEDDRYVEFIGEVMTSVSTLDNTITLLGFDSNLSQQCLITIDNNLYAFTFTKSTNNSYYCLSVVMLDNEGNTIEKVQISNIYEKSVSSLYECNKDTILFNTEDTKAQIYLANLSGAKEIQEEAEQGNSTVSEDAKYDLRNYGILISNIDMNQFTNALTDIFKAHILKS